MKKEHNSQISGKIEDINKTYEAYQKKINELRDKQNRIIASEVEKIKKNSLGGIWSKIKNIFKYK